MGLKAEVHGGADVARGPWERHGGQEPAAGEPRVGVIRKRSGQSRRRPGR